MCEINSKNVKNLLKSTVLDREGVQHCYKIKNPEGDALGVYQIPIVLCAKFKPLGSTWKGDTLGTNSKHPEK